MGFEQHLFVCFHFQFSVGIDKVEDLKIKADDDRLTEVQLTYDSMRRGNQCVLHTAVKYIFTHLILMSSVLCILLPCLCQLWYPVLDLRHAGIHSSPRITSQCRSFYIQSFSSG